MITHIQHGPLFALLLLLTACQTHVPHAHDPAKLQALAQVLVPVRTINFSDENFNDLQPLKAKWQNVRIVLLGEATHGDGATFAAKVRLIKFLHRELGFEVLAFESGLYDCEKAWTLMQAGVPTSEAAPRALFGLWAESRQVQPLFDYLDAEKATPRPLRLAGFDLQFSGSLSRDSLLVDLEKFMHAADADTTSWRVVKTTLDTLFRYHGRFRKMSSEQRDNFYAASANLRESIAATHSEDAYVPFALQLLRSTETLRRFLWNADFNKPDPKILNLRDQQMGENLLWLARERFPNKKIIVWAATSHSTRNRQSIRAKIGGTIGESEMIPMGDYVWKELHEHSYVLGFVAHHGRSGVRGRAPWDLAEPLPGSLEDWLGHTAYDYAILDWRSLPANAQWLADTLLARPMGFVPMRARWPEIMDGVMFIREMTPSVAIE